VPNDCSRKAVVQMRLWLSFFEAEMEDREDVQTSFPVHSLYDDEDRFRPGYHPNVV
jgi:hypothetical protein